MTPIKKVTATAFILIAVFIASGCALKKAPEKRIPVTVSQPGPYDITGFSFKAENNPSLASDIDATIEKTSSVDEWLYGSHGTITAWVPYGTDIMNLVADYKTEGSHVSVNGVIQENGKTANDFSDTVIYRVYAGNDDYRFYQVNVNESPGNGNEITAFMFRSEKNPSLVVDYYAEINGTQITVTLTGSADPSSLIASFASTGSRITVNGVDQKSGITANDFTGTVIYTVEAADGTARDYSVSVETSADAAREMTSFALTASANPELRNDIQGTITGTDIALTVPANVTVTSLIPSFTTSGGAVTVEGAIQTSGSTSCDFSDDVCYRVTAADGSYIDYRVTVTLTHHLRWAATFGGTNDAYNNYWSGGTAIARDSSDNIYVAGYIQGTADLDPGPGAESAGPGVFIMKLDSAGSRIWTRVIIGYSLYPNINVKGIAVDVDDNAFITGNFENTIDFDPGAGTDNHTAASSDTDVYVTRINSDGGYGWTATFGSDYQKSTALAVDSSGDIFVAGHYEWIVDFDPSAVVENHTSSGGWDIFITKITSAGNYAWTRTIGGTDYDDVMSIAADAGGGVYLTGYFNSSVDFDPGPGEDVRQADDHHSETLYVMKLMSDGTYGWTCTGAGWGGMYGRSLHVDADSNAYVAASLDYNGAYIARINSDGSQGWGRSMAPVNLNSNKIFPYSISAGAEGRLYIAGYYSGTVDFDPTPRDDTRTALASNWGYGNDIFITQLNAGDGSYGSTMTLPAPEDDQATSVAVDSQGYVYMTGSFRETIDVDPTSAVDTRTSNGDCDVIIAGYQFP